jgi:hypothetical protein
MQETYQKGFTLTERGINSVSMATPVFTARLCILIGYNFFIVGEGLDAIVIDRRGILSATGA